MKKLFTLIISSISLVSYSQKLDTNYVKNKIEKSLNQLELNLEKEINQLESEISKNSSLNDSLNKSTLEILNSNNTQIKNLSNELLEFQKKFGEINKLQKSLNKLISSLNVKLKSLHPLISYFDAGDGSRCVKSYREILYGEYHYISIYPISGHSRTMGFKSIVTM